MAPGGERVSTAEQPARLVACVPSTPEGSLSVHECVNIGWTTGARVGSPGPAIGSQSANKSSSETVGMGYWNQPPLFLEWPREPKPTEHRSEWKRSEQKTSKGQFQQILFGLVSSHQRINKKGNLCLACWVCHHAIPSKHCIGKLLSQWGLDGGCAHRADTVFQ